MSERKASVIIVTFNNLESATKPCIESIYDYTDVGDFELIVVDNDSTDGTKEYLGLLKEEHPNVKIKINNENKGFAGGNNDGLRLAEGKYLVLLNNDTLVTPGWLDSLLLPLEKDRQIGLVGPISNAVGNEQMVTLEGMTEKSYVAVSEKYTRIHGNCRFDTERLGFFCVAMRRQVFNKVGFLDERFGIGFFEDDDYCIRVRSLGYRLVFTEACFVYHKGSLSFSKLGDQMLREMVDKNRVLFSRKHGKEWTYSDVVIAYLNKIERDLNTYRDAALDGEAGPYIERVTVRLPGLRDTVEGVRGIEKKMIKQIKHYGVTYSRWVGLLEKINAGIPFSGPLIRMGEKVGKELERFKNKVKKWRLIRNTKRLD
ncbi:MAG: glycosyltransferase [Deltaproteobacteria bacterium]|nr:glycosyltransferase [Deltaproteobacteria bacterium]